jgi:iron complex transport system permease protein
VKWWYVLSGGFVLGATLLGLLISSVSIPLPTILHILLEKSVGLGFLDGVEANVEQIIWEIRLPRVLLGLLVGASLALAGAAFQGLLRNPLADPYTIGVSSGAALGAVCVIFFQLTFLGLGFYSVPFFAIAGGMLALAIVFGLTYVSSRSMAVETVILAGIIISSFFSSFISLIVAFSGEELRQILFWLMGSVGMRGWNYFYLLLPFFVVGSLLILIHHRELNALAFGDESAQHMGVQVQKRKVFILLGASLLTGAAVAVSGMIGFVGLVIPHLVRLVVGPNHRYVLPLSMLIGGAFLVLADLISRTVIAPRELPIGVITAIIGAPVFALLLIREKRRKGG